MENNNREPSAGYVFESAMEHMHRIHRLDVIIIIILSILLAAEGIIFMIMWNQYDYTDTSDEYSVDLDADDGGNANYIGNDGDIYNGTSESNPTQKDKEQDS